MIFRLYTELDMLLDTRIAAVSEISEEAAIELLSDKYRYRQSDELWLLTNKITEEQFKTAYKNRSIETLARARPTPMLMTIADTVKAESLKFHTAHNLEAIELDVNIYPYDLSDDIKDAILECLMAYCGVEVRYRFIRVAPYELTFKQIKLNQYNQLFVYNFIEWAEIHIEKFGEGDPMMPSVCMIIPELIKSVAELEAEDLKDIKCKNKDPFDALRLMMAALLAIQVVPVDLVSILEIPPDLFAQG